MPKSRRSAKSVKAAAPAKPPRSGRAFAADYFSFHAVCKNRTCRRAKRCEGGALPPCFTAFWPHIEEREKMRFRGFIKALANRASVKDAIAAGDAEAARSDAIERQLQQYDRAAATPRAEQTAEPPAPLPAITRVPRPVARVRQL